MKNFIRSLFCHTTIDGEFNSRNYILTKICSDYIIEEKTNILSKERGAHIMERKKDSNEIRDYRKKILNLLNKIENQDNLERIYKYMKHVYIHFPK